jgi:hypothetical protein
MVRLLMLLTLLASDQTFACGTFSATEQRARDKEDVEKQLVLVKQLAAKSDRVFVGRVESVDNQLRRATLIPRRALIGSTERQLSLSWQVGIVVVSCYAYTSFDYINLEVGREYVFYAAGSNILRAGSTNRGPGELSVREELRAIRRGNGT